MAPHKGTAILIEKKVSSNVRVCQLSSCLVGRIHLRAQSVLSTYASRQCMCRMARRGLVGLPTCIETCGLATDPCQCTILFVSLSLTGMRHEYAYGRNGGFVGGAAALVVHAGMSPICARPLRRCPPPSTASALSRPLPSFPVGFNDCLGMPFVTKRRSNPWRSRTLKKAAAHRHGTPLLQTTMLCRRRICR